jgi:hypothetical protein
MASNIFPLPASIGSLNRECCVKSVRGIIADEWKIETGKRALGMHPLGNLFLL